MREFAAMGRDRLLVELDSAVGGIGGVHLDREGVLVVSVTGTVLADSVLSALRAHPQGNRLTVTRQGAPRSVRVERVRYRASELARFGQLIAPLLSTLGGDAFSDLDETRNVVRVGVTSDDAEARLRSEIGRMGLPQDAVTVARIRAFRDAGSLLDRFRPTGAGIQIRVRYNILQNYWETCTLGFNVTNASGQRLAMSAAHCANYTGSGQDYYVSNPTNGSSSNWIGYTSALAPTYSCNGGASACIDADVMLLTYHSNVASPARIIHTSSSGGSYAAGTLNRSSGDVWQVVGSAYIPELNDVLHKIGRTTGWTHGYVVGVCETWYNAARNLYKMCQDRVLAYADNGDSGGPVFFEDPALPDSVRVPAGISNGVVTLLEPPAPGQYVTYLVFSNRAQIASVLGALNYQ